jgi:TolB-like protein/thioredoxin-like negative regulator of GroEL
MSDILLRLKQRKLVQWALAYVAFAFALIQVLDVVAQRFAWPDQLERVLILALAIGFVVALVLAWYHGERGAQRVSSTEIVILALLLAIGGGLLWRFERATPSSGSPDAAQRNPGKTVPDSIAGAIPSGLQRASSASAPVNSPGSQATAIPAKSIAVLPFVNMSGDPQNEYFSDGITEEILDALAQVPNLKVAARTSAFAFKGKAEDLRKVGEVLDVATVLEGSVQKSGDEVRITAQLIDTRSGYHLWSEKYDRKLTSIFAVEDEISKAIADKLKVQMAGAGGQSLVAQKAIDPLAHDFYLRGLTLLAARSVKEAAEAFQQAVAIDPGYAQGWAALAEAEALLPAYTLTPAQASYARSLDAARHALALDPDTASAYVARGMVYGNQMRWADADSAFQRALALAPGDAEAMDQYAQFLFAVGQLEPALAEIDRALERDPLSGVSGSVRAQLLLALHHDDAALQQIESTLTAHPDGVFVHRSALWVYLVLHRYSEAERQARMASKLNGEDQDASGLLIRGIADPPVRKRAIQILDTSPAMSGIRKDAFVHASFLLLLGERERALVVLADFVPNGESNTVQFLWSPALDPIRTDPRFKAVLKKIGLPYKPAAGAAP